MLNFLTNKYSKYFRKNYYKNLFFKLLSVSLVFLISLALSYYKSNIYSFLNIDQNVNQKVTTSEISLNSQINLENKNFVYYNDFVVTKIVDGDTVHVKNSAGEDVVRIMAVNTLEKDSTDPREKCFANLATDFTKMNLSNKNVKLYYDRTQPKRDKYGRILAYVQIAGENSFYNESLMNSGLSKVYKATPPATEYVKYENIMQNNILNKIGIWDEKLCNI